MDPKIAHSCCRKVSKYFYYIEENICLYRKNSIDKNNIMTYKNTAIFVYLSEIKTVQFKKLRRRKLVQSMIYCYYVLHI